MVTPVLEGSITTKADTTSQTLINVSMTDGECLIVIVSFKGSSLPSEVRWGLRDLTRIGHRIDTVNLFGVAIYTIRAVGNTDTRDIVVTYPSSITVKITAAISIPSIGNVKDQVVNSLNGDTAAPSVGSTLEMEVSDELAIAVLCSEGATNDIEPSLSIGWTKLSRIGTIGVPPISNNTIVIAYQQLSSSIPITLSGTGATVRDWVSVLVTLRPIKLAVPLDINGMEILVGDTVEYNNAEGSSTVSSFTSSRGSPFSKVTLANGLVYNAHTLEVIS